MLTVRVCETKRGMPENKEGMAMVNYVIKDGPFPIYPDPTYPNNIYTSSANGENYSEAGGIRRFVSDTVKNVRQRKNLKASSKADVRRAKASSKTSRGSAREIAARAQYEAAKGLSKTQPSSATKTVVKKDSAGMSTAAKVGIGVGVVVVLVIVGVVIYKSKKK